jgi:transcriptional regulator with XRE-family HTH domain
MATTVYGPTLRKERLAASVTATALADKMGVTRQSAPVVTWKHRNV